MKKKQQKKESIIISNDKGLDLIIEIGHTISYIEDLANEFKSYDPIEQLELINTILNDTKNLIEIMVMIKRRKTSNDRRDYNGSDNYK